MRGVVEFFAVAREEDGAGAGAVADADDVTLVEGGRVRGTIKRLVVAALAEGCVSDRVFVPTCVVMLEWGPSSGVSGTYRVT